MGSSARKPSDYTFQQPGGELAKHSYQSVKNHLKSLFDNPLTDYGYHRMTGALQLAGFFINHKKVWLLVKPASTVILSGCLGGRYRGTGLEGSTFSRLARGVPPHRVTWSHPVSLPMARCNTHRGHLEPARRAPLTG